MRSPQSLGFETELPEVLPLQTPSSLQDRARIRGSLLTVCAIDERDLALSVDADAEDMEAYGCAAACALAGIPLMVLRGISNVRGERDKSQWRIADALKAAQQSLVTYLEQLVGRASIRNEN
jgi:hypothetical protein